MSKLLHTIIVLLLHLLGDYVVQRLTHGILPHKRASVCGMLIHCLYAEGMASAYIGYISGGIKGAVVGLIIGVASHYAIDTMGTTDKGLVAKLIDQALHTIALAIVYYITRTL